MTRLIEALTRLRQSTLQRLEGQVYRVFANDVELLWEGRSPTVYNASTNDVLKIPNWEFGQRTWRVSIPVGSQGVQQARLDAAWELRSRNGYRLQCRALSIDLANVGNTFEVILVEQVFR